MRCLVLCNVGFENIVSNELLFFECKNIKCDKGFIIFEIESFEKMFELYYSARSFNKLILLLQDFSFSSFEELSDNISSIDISGWIIDDFGVDCLRIGNHDFTSFDVRQLFTKIFSNKYSLSVDYKSSFQFFSLINEDKCFFGVDFCRVDLGKRDYRIFLKGQNLKGNEAFCLLYSCDLKKVAVLLDPICRSGIFPIEAALYLSNKSPNFFNKNKFSFIIHPKFKDCDFDSFFEKIDNSSVNFSNKISSVDSFFPNLQAAKKNAKIAGVSDLIEFGKINIDDLDIKFEKNSVELIVVFPEKNLDELFFRQCNLILNPEGKIFIVSKNTVASKNFSLFKKFSFFQGKDELFVYIFQKTTTQHL